MKILTSVPQSQRAVACASECFDALYPRGFSPGTGDAEKRMLAATWTRVLTADLDSVAIWGLRERALQEAAAVWRRRIRTSPARYLCLWINYHLLAFIGPKRTTSRLNAVGTTA